MARGGMAFAAVAVLMCLAVAQAARMNERTQGTLRTFSGPKFEPPKWYHGHDGPIFEVTQTGDDKELRHYHPTVWATTNITNTKVDEALDQGSERLDNYFGGDNKGKSKIDETVPTLAILYVSKEQPGTVKSDLVTIQYFVPHELHDAPPAPDAKEINLLRFGDESIWVKSFGGYAHEKEILEQGFRFLKELEDASVKVRTDAFGFAYYDKMYHIINRHNEIWVWAEQEPSVAVKTEAVANEAVAQARQSVQATAHKVQSVLNRNN